MFRFLLSELRKKEMKIHSSIDNIMAPPISFSAPEINVGSFYIEETYDVPIREAFSSTELLHEKKMARLYQSLEEIEAENEEYKQKLKLAEVAQQKLTRKRSLTDKRKILLERRRSSEAEESDSGRKYSEQFDKLRKNKLTFGEDEETGAVSDVNNVSDDNSRAEGGEEKKIDLGKFPKSSYFELETREFLISLKYGGRRMDLSEK